MNTKPLSPCVVIVLFATIFCALGGGCAGKHYRTGCAPNRRSACPPSAQPWHLPYGYHATCWRPWPWDGSPCPQEPILAEPIDVGTSPELERMPLPEFDAPPERLPGQSGDANDQGEPRPARSNSNGPESEFAPLPPLSESYGPN